MQDGELLNRERTLNFFSLPHEQQAEPIESTIDPVRSVFRGTVQVFLPRDGERKVFQGAISIRKGDWEEHQPVCDTVVTVFESNGPGAHNRPDADIYLRAAVFYSKLAAYAEVSIKGFQDLRQVTTFFRCLFLNGDRPLLEPRAKHTPQCN